MPKIFNPNHLFAGDTAFEVLPSNGMVSGETVCSWTEDWWRWTVRQPLSNTGDANWDNNGSFESTQPSGGMYFLAGSWGSDPAAGTVRGTDQNPIHVPAGSPILVPIFTLISSQFQSDPKNYNNVTLKDWKVSVNDLFLKIDGQDVKNLQSDLVRTGVFSAGAPAPDTIGAYLADPATGSPDGLKSIGYWGVVALAPGAHQIEFGGSSPTYSVHVIDKVMAS